MVFNFKITCYTDVLIVFFIGFKLFSSDTGNETACKYKAYCQTEKWRSKQSMECVWFIYVRIGFLESMCNHIYVFV